MGDIDPETEALMRKLHRELNGLTRSTRPRGQAGGARTTRAEAPASPSDSETSASSSGSEEEEDEGEDDEGEGKEEDEEEERVGERGEARPLGGREQERRAHGGAAAVAAVAAGSGGAQGAAAAAYAARGVKRARNDLAGESQPYGRPTKQVSPGSHATAAADAQPVADPFKTPLEAAAAAAAHEVRSKARKGASMAAAASAQPEPLAHAAGHPPMIKCFHAGVRWGITLPRDSIKSRAELATQLNNAFAGEILSCGRGDILTILFLDADGHTTEFQALRGAGAHDSSRQWGASVERALKVYVRRS